MISDHIKALPSFLLISIRHGRMMPKKYSIIISEINKASWVANSFVLFAIKYRAVENISKNSMLNNNRVMVSDNVNNGSLCLELLKLFPELFLWFGQCLILLNSYVKIAGCQLSSACRCKMTFIFLNIGGFL